MLKIDNLGKRYDQSWVLKDINLALSPGEILTIVGPSGAGKTTLLRLIAGLEIPEQGTIRINDKQVSSAQKMVAPHTRRLSMIFQDLALWPHMTVKKHIQFVMKGKRRSTQQIEETVIEVLAGTRLSGYENRYPHELSGGEKQRLALARAWAPGPDYILLDEPFSDLDHLLRDDLQQVLTGLVNDFNVGILLVTHDIDEAIALADRLAVLNHGQIEQIGKVVDVLGKPQNDFIKRFLKVKEQI